jgi:hypothetical protein
MSANYLSKPAEKIAKWGWLRSSWALAIILPLWILFGLTVAVLTTYALVYVLGSFGISLVGINQSILEATYAALTYVLTLAIVIGVPYAFHKYTSREDLGLKGLLTWKDIGLAPAGFVVYFIASSLLVYFATQIFSGFDGSQTQETGFTHLSGYGEYALAFTTLIIVAPVAEEILFRGFLYGKLRRRMPVWVAILITSALFGLIHGQWNVGLDVFALSIVLCSLREITGSIWSGILLHMLKNSVAFFIIFISPML